MNIGKICDYLYDIGILELDSIKDFLNLYSNLTLDRTRDNSTNIIMALSSYLSKKMKSEQDLNKLSENIITSFSNQNIINRYKSLKIFIKIFNSKLNMRYSSFFREINLYTFKKFIYENNRKNKKKVNDSNSAKTNYNSPKKLNKNNRQKPNSASKYNEHIQNNNLKTNNFYQYDLSQLYPYRPLINENSRKICNSKNKEKITRENFLLFYPFNEFNFKEIKKPKEYKIISEITSKRKPSAKSPKKQKNLSPKKKEKMITFSEKRKKNKDKEKSNQPEIKKEKEEIKEKINEKENHENEQNEEIDKDKNINNDNEISNKGKEIKEKKEKEEKEEKEEKKEKEINKTHDINLEDNNMKLPKDNTEEIKIKRPMDNKEDIDKNTSKTNQDDKNEKEKENLQSLLVNSIQESSLSMSLNLEKRMAEIEKNNSLKTKFASKALNELTKGKI